MATRLNRDLYSRSCGAGRRVARAQQAVIGCAAGGTCHHPNPFGACNAPTLARLILKIQRRAERCAVMAPIMRIDGLRQCGHVRDRPGSSAVSSVSGLTHDLIQSLDAPRDNGVEDAWEREISQRIGEVDAGQAESVERGEFRKRIRAKLKRQ